MSAEAPTDMERSAIFFLMLDYDEDAVLAGLMDQHPFETEEDMRAAIEVAMSHKTQFQADMSAALDREAIEEEHRA